MELSHPEDVSADAELAEKVKNGEMVRYHVIKRYLTKTNAVVTCQLWVLGVYEHTKCVGFVGWVSPVPNSGRFKTTTDNEGRPVARPMIKFYDLLVDNLPLVLSLAGPALAGLVAAVWWFATKMAEMQAAVEAAKKAAGHP